MPKNGAEPVPCANSGFRAASGATGVPRQPGLKLKPAPKRERPRQAIGPRKCCILLLNPPEQ
jgi:hypothetical protein